MQKPFQTSPWELGHLLDSIDKGQIVVPEFQRSFVWDPGDTKDLILSIANSYPAGSLLFVRQKHDHALESRPIEGVATDARHLLDPEKLVLDGQQRLTSLYQALYGRGNHRFFINIGLLRDGGELEDALVYKRSERETEYDTAERQYYYRHLPLTCILGRDPTFDKWMFEFIEYRVEKFGEDRKDLQEWLTGLRDKFLTPIQKYEFPVIELSDSTSLEAICRIFETLNLKGVKLTVFEILTAKLFSKLKLRDLWKNARDTYLSISQFLAEDDSAYVLKTVALLKYKDDPSLTLSCKRSALLDLNAEDIIRHWDEAVGSVSDALVILKNEHGILSKKWLPYVTILPPLAALLNLSESLSPSPAEGDARNKTFRWFWASVFSQRYESGTDTKSVTDLTEVMTWVKGGAEPEAVRNFRFDTSTLKAVSEQRNAIYRGLISIVVKNGALDFHNKSEISTLDLQKEGIEDHHVFPFQYLVDMGVKGEVKNCILNRTLIDASTNSSIGKRAPSDYMEDLRMEDREQILRSHLLIRDLDSPLFRDEFLLFLGERQEIFGEILADLTGAKYDAATKIVSSPNYSPEAAEDDEERRQREAPQDLSAQLSEALRETFQRVGSSNVYQSSTRTVVARWSHRYDAQDTNYWYRLTPKDLSSAVTSGVSGYAYVCGTSGTIVVPAEEMKFRVEQSRLNSTRRDGQIQNYHIKFCESKRGMEWLQKDGTREVIERFFHKSNPSGDVGPPQPAGGAKPEA